MAGTVTVAVVVLAVTGFVLRGRLVEEWYCRMLDSGEPELRQLAARKLGEMRSVRALARLKALCRGPEMTQAYAKALGSIGLPALPFALEAMTDPDLKVRTRGVLVLMGIATSVDVDAAPSMIPKLADLLEAEHPQARLAAASALAALRRRTRIEGSSAEAEKTARILKEDWGKIWQGLPVPPVPPFPPAPTQANSPGSAEKAPGE